MGDAAALAVGSDLAGEEEKPSNTFAANASPSDTVRPD